ncbi:MAG: phosphatase [bacterium]|nr:phosphatase [bacterium]
MEREMYAVIDIGSNTIRLSIFNIVENKIKLILNKKEMTGLASYVDKHKNLTKEGMAKAIDVLLEYRNVLEQIHIEHVFVFATASLRNVHNSIEATAIITRHCGFDIRVLSGKEEAMFDHFGSIQTVKDKHGLLVDIGGGSTELVFYKEKEIVKAISLPVGSLTMYTSHVAEILPKKSEIKKISEVVEQHLSHIQLQELEFDNMTICGVGGTVRAACKLNNTMLGLPKDNLRIEVEDLQAMTSYLQKEKKEMSGIVLKVVPERIHTLFPGITILNTVAKIYDAGSVVVSPYGVREGYLYYQLLKKGKIQGESLDEKLYSK